MPAKRPVGVRNETVECEDCGEHYAVTYKRCPFCNRKPTRQGDERTIIFRRPTQQEIDAHAREQAARRSRPENQDLPRRDSRFAPDYEDEDDYEDEPMRRFVAQKNYDLPDDHGGGNDDDDDDYEYDDRPSGGRRMVESGRRGPSVRQIIGGVLSLAIIVAAAYIVFTIVKPFLDKQQPEPPPSVTPAVTETASPSPSGTVSPSPAPSASGEPEPTAPTTIPSGQTADGFSLTNGAGKRLQDITLSAQSPNFTFTVSFSPAGTTGSVSWSSSKPGIVSVDQNGKVTAVSQGVATITATMAGGYAQECIVRSSAEDAASPSAGPSPSAPPSLSPSPSTSPSPAGGKLSFNVSGGNDFTLTGAGDSWTLKVNNAVGTPTWSVKDSSIATVNASGKVTAVAKGITTVTATVDGQALECTVRVNIH
jgi:cytoskeletal protein RodZ